MLKFSNWITLKATFDFDSRSRGGERSSACLASTLRSRSPEGSGPVVVRKCSWIRARMSASTLSCKEEFIKSVSHSQRSSVHSYLEIDFLSPISQITALAFTYAMGRRLLGLEGQRSVARSWDGCGGLAVGGAVLD